MIEFKLPKELADLISAATRLGHARVAKVAEDCARASDLLMALRLASDTKACALRAGNASLVLLATRVLLNLRCQAGPLGEVSLQRGYRNHLRKKLVAQVLRGIGMEELLATFRKLSDADCRLEDLKRAARRDGGTA